MRNIYRSLLLAGLLLSPLFLSGQDTPPPIERSDNKVILEGRVYYIHVVKAGQTLYAISRAYGISEKEVAVENPGVYSGLQIGQVLKIPMAPGLPLEKKPGEEQQISYDEEGYVSYKVRRRDTMYSIARKYKVSEEAIRACNPELEWDGLRAGSTIWIPLPQVVAKTDTLQSAPVDSMTVESDTLDNLPDYNYSELLEEHANIRRTYRVAFFMPFNFTDQEPLDTLLKDVKSPARKARIIEQYKVEQKVPQSVHFLEFFQGALLAIDSMRSIGMKMDVRFYDTRRSMDRMLSILTENELDDFDLFIGPFYPFNLELVSAFSEMNRIPMVAPFYNDRQLLEQNPYLFQLTPSLESEYDELSKLIASKYDYNIIYVRNMDSLDVEKHEYLKQQIFDDLDDYHPVNPVVFKEVVQKLDRTNELLHSLSSEKKNLVVVPTGNEAIASSVVSSLVYQLNNYDIEVIGTPYWTQFSSINFKYFHELNLVFYSPFWLDYGDPDVERFLKKYREHYYTEPLVSSKRGISYGIAGHDITLFFMNALRTKGPRFILDLDNCRQDLVLDTYQFTRISSRGGYENSNFSFYRFQKDMSIIEFDVPEPPKREYFFKPLEDRRKRRYLNKD